MNKLLVSAALAGVLAAGFSVSAQAGADESKEKCYGVAKAGENDCKTVKAEGGSCAHSCKGHSKTDKDPNEWKYVGKGECVKSGGTLEVPKKG